MSGVAWCSSSFGHSCFSPLHSLRCSPRSCRMLRLESTSHHCSIRSRFFSPGKSSASAVPSRALLICSCHRVLVSPAALPRFWLFMYRATPVTYFINAIVSTGVAGGDIVCAASEIIKFAPPSGQTCSLYLKEYMSYAGGTLLNPRATKQCDFCRVAGTDSVLASLEIYFGHRWRNFGISLIYSAVNVGGALCLYWLFRVPKAPGRRRV